MRTYLAHQRRHVHLGKAAPRIDPRTPRLHKFLTRAHLVATPPRQDWIAASRIAQWGMALNDQLGDCVIADMVHQVLMSTALQPGHIAQGTPDAVTLAAYEAVGGYVPGNPSTDNGCVMLDAIQYGMTHGYGGQKITAYATIDPHHFDVARAAINLFGSVKVGLALPISAQSQVGGLWDVPAGGATGDGAPGSWGGHDVPIPTYDAAAGIYTCVTWGGTQRMTERFLATYCDEMYACLWECWTTGGTGPNRFPLAILKQQLATENAPAIVDRVGAMPWATILNVVRTLIKTFGPAAVPFINAYIAKLPLSAAQKAAIETLIASLLGGA